MTLILIYIVLLDPELQNHAILLLQDRPILTQDQMTTEEATEDMKATLRQDKNIVEMEVAMGTVTGEPLLDIVKVVYKIHRILEPSSI